VRSRVTRDHAEEAVRRVGRFELARVLAFPAGPHQHEVSGARRELLTPEELLRAPAERELADRALAAAHDRFGERLGLIDRRDRLRLVADLLLARSN
jgi:hypothetical protein